MKTILIDNSDLSTDWIKGTKPLKAKKRKFKTTKSKPKPIAKPKPKKKGGKHG
jgi:hypothetical protein